MRTTIPCRLFNHICVQILSADTVKKRLDDKIRMAFGSYFILFIHKPEVHKIPGQLGRGDICIICIMSMVGGWHIRDSIYKV